MMWLVLLCAAAASACPIPPTHGMLEAQTCAFWRREVGFGNMSFGSDCFAVRYNDLTVAVGGQPVGEVTQTVVSLGTQLTVRACGVTLATVTERASSALNPLRGLRATYDMTSADGSPLAVVRRSVLFGKQLEFRGPTLNANVSVSFGEMMMGAVCAGSAWDVQCAGSACAAVVYSAAWFSLARGAAPPCNHLYWFVVVGVPVICVCCAVLCVIILKRRCCTNKCSI